MPRSPKKIYVFNKEYKLIHQFESVNYTSKVLCIPIDTIYASIYEKRICRELLYFSLENKFILKKIIHKTRKIIKNRIIYKFNLEGKLIDEYSSISEAVIKLNKQENTIRCAIMKKAFTREGYYLSLDINFIPPIKKNNFNPLLKKNYNDYSLDRRSKSKGIDRSIFLFNEDGNFICKYNSSKEASEILNISSYIIYYNKKNKKIFEGKFYFSDKIDFEVPIKVPKKQVVKSKKERPVLIKKIYQFNRYGKFECEYININFAIKKLKISEFSIRTAIKNKTIANYKYLFSYENKVESIKQDIPVYQFDLKGKLMFEFENITDAVKALKNTYTDTYNSIVTGKILRQKYYLRLQK